MPHLSSFELEQFRTFREPVNFDLAPLTILTGPNGSGKSSVFKALLLLRESAVQTQLEELTFSGGAHRLGGIESVLSHGASDTLTFRVGIEEALGDGLPVGPLNASPNEPGYFTARVGKAVRDLPNQTHVTLNYKQSMLRAFSIASGKDDVWLEVRTGETEQRDPRIAVPEFFEVIEVNGSWFYDHLGGSDAKVAEALNLDYNDRTAPFLSYIDGKIESVDFKGPVDSSSRIHISNMHEWLGAIAEHSRSSGSKTEEIDTLTERLVRNFLFFTVGKLLRRCTKALFGVLNGIEFNGTFREQRRRVFLADETARGFTRLLQKAAKSSDYSLKKTSTWLQRFGIGEKLRVDEVVEKAYAVSIERGDEVVSLADVGYGQAQLIPLLLHLGLRYSRTTLLLEEPEANLHPNLQSQLADLFVDLIGEIDGTPGFDLEAIQAAMEGKERPPQPKKLEKHLLVETHSEYLIRRLQYLVATGEADPERIVIYYLGPDPDADDYVRQIRIAEDGQLSKELGPGFLDEATNLMINLYKASSKN